MATKVPAPAKTPSRKGPPPAASQTVGNLDKPSPVDLKPLNFKVSAAFKREFKLYATGHGMSMVALLQEGFDLVKQKRGGA